MILKYSNFLEIFEKKIFQWNSHKLFVISYSISNFYSTLHLELGILIINRVSFCLFRRNGCGMLIERDISRRPSVEVSSIMPFKQGCNTVLILFSILLFDGESFLSLFWFLSDLYFWYCHYFVSICSCISVSIIFFFTFMFLLHFHF